MRQLKLIILIFITNTSLFGQVDNSNLLLGTWELHKEEGKSDVLITLNDSKDTKPKKRELLLKFNNNGRVDIKDNGDLYKADYSLSGDKLQLGDTKYFVEKISMIDLILKEDSDFLPLTYIYKKTEKEIESIKDTEDIFEKYPNGKAKLQGQKIDGFKNGIWIEWYESGQIKRVTHYNLDIPYMDIEFDNNGEVKSKSYFDLKSKGYKRE